jgi:hypothetical protein
MTILFLSLGYYMRNFHFFEYRKNKRQLIFLYLCFLAYLIIKIIENSRFVWTWYIYRMKNLMCSDDMCDKDPYSLINWIDRVINIVHDEF